MITPLFDPSDGPMRVAGFMSGSGTNLVNLIEHELANPGTYSIEAVFTDKPKKSKAAEIAEKYKLPLIGLAFMGFYDELGVEPQHRTADPRYYEEAARLLEAFNVHCLALAGYMRVVHPSLLKHYPLTVNVHPADLSRRGADGRRLYTGDDAVALAMISREPTVRASTHLVTEVVDAGPLLLLSAPMVVDYHRTPSENQARLKEVGDWVIFPKTLEYIASGRFGRDENGNMQLDSKPIPDGARLEEL